MISLFTKLTDLSLKRTPVQGLGFYLAYFLATLLLAVVAAVALAVLTGQQQSYEFGMRVGTFVAIATSLSLSFMVISKKKLTGSFLNLLLILISGVLAYFGGALLGLIPVAYLTTK